MSGRPLCSPNAGAQQVVGVADDVTVALLQLKTAAGVRRTQHQAVAGHHRVEMAPPVGRGANIGRAVAPLPGVSRIPETWLPPAGKSMEVSHGHHRRSDLAAAEGVEQCLAFAGLVDP